MSWGLEKTYDNDDVRYMSFYVCRGSDTIILEVRILKGYLGRLLAIITTHNTLSHIILSLSEVTLHLSRSRVAMMSIDLLPSQSLMFTSMQNIVKSAILKSSDSVSHSEFRFPRLRS